MFAGVHNQSPLAINYARNNELPKKSLSEILKLKSFYCNLNIPLEVL